MAGGCAVRRWRTTSAVLVLVLAIVSVSFWAEIADPPQNAPPVTWNDFGIFLAQPLVYAAAIISAVLLLTRRILFSLTLALVTAVALTVLSKAKYTYLQQKLLFTDFYFQFRESAEILFFVQNYTGVALTVLALTLAALVTLGLVFRLDHTRIHRAVALAALLVSAVGVEYAWRQVHWIYRDTVFAHASASNRHLSNFTVSARMLFDHLSRPLVLGDGTEPPANGVAPTLETPATAQERPHIIVILHESSVDPAIYYDDPRYAVQPSYFQSGDGVVRRLDVKAYGGKTWISEHGFVLGADLSYFSSRKDFLGVVATDKFRNSIAQELATHGYSAAVNYPAPITFLNSEGFYHSLGFETVNSERDMGLEIEFGGHRPRDRDYFQFLIDDLARKQKEGDARPSFYFALTSANHYPWNYEEFPGVRDDEFVPGDDVAEYARRQRIGADDLDWLEAELARRFPGQQFLIAGFGDHHPLWTHDYVHGLGTWKGRPPDPTEHMWRTYYYVEGVNFNPDYAVLSPEIEIGFLGESVLSAARLPLGKSYQVRRWLRERCEGLWADCKDVDTLRVANALLNRGPQSIFKD